MCTVYSSIYHGDVNRQIVFFLEYSETMKCFYLKHVHFKIKTANVKSNYIFFVRLFVFYSTSKWSSILSFTVAVVAIAMSVSVYSVLLINISSFSFSSKSWTCWSPEQKWSIKSDKACTFSSHFEICRAIFALAIGVDVETDSSFDREMRSLVVMLISSWRRFSYNNNPNFNYTQKLSDPNNYCIHVNITIIKLNFSIRKQKHAEIVHSQKRKCLVHAGKAGTQNYLSEKTNRN